MTDGDGRLVLLPGPGRAYSKGNHPLTTFSGNDGWTDDVCDGPVHATVRIDGRTIEAEPAWALVTPPNYGPGVSTGLVTLYDAARSMFVASGGLDPGDVSFADDILPIFARMTDMQWVNEGFFLSNGFGSKEDWLTDENVARLADPARAHVPSRVVQALPQSRLPDRPDRERCRTCTATTSTSRRRTSGSGSQLRRSNTGGSARGRTAATSTTATALSPCRPTSRACPRRSRCARSTAPRSSPASAARSIPESKRRGR